jgi:hypothetical protein
MHGHCVDTHGHCVDTHGHCVDTHGHCVDTHGRAYLHNVVQIKKGRIEKFALF